MFDSSNLRYSDSPYSARVWRSIILRLGVVSGSICNSRSLASNPTSTDLAAAMVPSESRGGAPARTGWYQSKVPRDALLFRPCNTCEAGRGTEGSDLESRPSSTSTSVAACLESATGLLDSIRSSRFISDWGSLFTEFTARPLSRYVWLGNLEDFGEGVSTALHFLTDVGSACVAELF